MLFVQVKMPGIASRQTGLTCEQQQARIQMRRLLQQFIAGRAFHHEGSCLLLFYAVIRSLKFRRIAVETRA